MQIYGFHFIPPNKSKDFNMQYRDANAV